MSEVMLMKQEKLLNFFNFASIQGKWRVKGFCNQLSFGIKQKIFITINWCSHETNQCWGNHYQRRDNQNSQQRTKLKKQSKRAELQMVNIPSLMYTNWMSASNCWESISTRKEIYFEIDPFKLRI